MQHKVVCPNSDFNTTLVTEFLEGIAFGWSAFLTLWFLISFKQYPAIAGIIAATTIHWFLFPKGLVLTCTLLKSAKAYYELL